MHVKRANFLFLLCPILPLLALLCDSQHAFLVRDVALAYLPAKRFWVDSILATHSVPGWNPLSYAGIPYRADLNLSPLHPLNFLFLIFPRSVDKGYLLFLGAHLLLLAVGSYLLFRKLRTGRDGALLAALAFTLGGITFSTLNLMNVAASFSALPFFLLFLLRLRRRFGWGDLVGISIAGAWPVYSGDPQFSYWMALIALVLVAIQCRREKNLTPLGRTIGAAPLVLGLASAQLLPAIALAVGSERGLGAHRLAVAERFSFHPVRLLEFFLPLPFGNPGLSEGYWLNSFTESVFNMPFLLSVYVGVFVATGLMVFGARSIFRWRRQPLGWVLLGLLLAAFGQYLFINVYGGLFYAVPGWKLFRYPERLLFLLVLGLFVWLAPFFRWCVVRVREGGFPARALNVAALTMILAVAGTVLCVATFSLEVHTLIGSIGHVAFLTALFCVFLRFRHRLSAHSRFTLLYALIALDLLPYGFALTWKTPANDVQYQQNTFAEKIHRNLAERAGPVSKGAATRYFHGTYTGPFPTTSTNPLVVGQAWDWGVMYPNVPMYFGLAGAAGYSPFDPKEILGLWAKYGHKDPQRLLDLFAIAYYPLRDGDHPALQLNPVALPQAWLPGYVSLRPEEQQEELLFQKDFPYRERAVVAGAGGEWAQISPWRIDSYVRLPDVATIRLKAASPSAYFVWNERWNANWAAYLDGQRLEVLRANTWAMAVYLTGPNADHTLEFRYEDAAAALGNKITVLTLLLILLGSIGTLLPFYRRRSAPSHR